ncbi:DUF1853 family protein [Marinobacterium stanieri]|uniref:DUF1853 family protein n=1 Tax=Marinobacterium stanieri TaxID=49186 RepID=UPI0002EEA6E7|nr:DUF1853 family protein [Marinobacterium stanieri]
MTAETQSDGQGALRGLQASRLRHLAWLCQAPQLYVGKQSFMPQDWLPSGWQQTLLAWEQQPDQAPKRLQTPAPRRLGAYFEILYQILIEDLLGWTIEAQNQQIIRDGQTLGELDFLVRNHHTGGLEHHEIAVKFYLGYPGQEGEAPLWYGPNSRDRLDLKTDRLLTHQSKMALRQEGQQLLQQLGLDEPVTPKVFMPGYLFQPEGPALPLPEQVGAHLDTGHWRRLSTFSTADGIWVPLHKPDWLGPYWQSDCPESSAVEARVRECTEQAWPCLLARLEQTELGWQERERCFLVPDGWPGAAVRS